MNGLIHVLAEPSGAAAPIIGILYAEDFDDVPAAEEQPPPEPAPPPLTQDDVDRACQAAVAAARQQWQTQAEQRRTDLLGSINNALAEARDTAEQIALTTAEATVKTMLAMLSGALPRLCNEHGAAEARAIVDDILPMLRSEPRIVIRVHPDLAADLRRDLADLQHDFTGTLSVLATAIEPGDVRIEWENGALSRDTRQILQAMQDVLALLGLQQSRETTRKKEMAHAE